MKLDVSVKNLGQIKEATFNIRPMTVITGPNGTGKSFFTKSLYSILNVVNRNVYREELNGAIQGIQQHLDLILWLREQSGNLVETKEDNAVNEVKGVGVIGEISDKLKKLRIEFDFASSLDIKSYLAFAASKVADLKELFNELFSDTEAKLEWLTITNTGVGMGVNFKNLLSQLRNPEESYVNLCAIYIADELKDNFQISDLNDLTNFEADQAIIEMNGLLTLSIKSGQAFFATKEKFIDDIEELSSVLFFESPAYWKIREALTSAKNKQNISHILNKRSDDFLTGVPKYFYDLDNALTIKTKTEGAFKSATDILEKELGGEFIFKGDNLSFKDKSGREISKHLVSFGMTNLGMIQALLKHNVITEGSFIFIDEPETNLHPDWQVKLAEVLLVLAQGGVNIVITTHSSDFVKALEVKIKKLHIEIMEDFLSVHFVDVDGKLLEFESTDKIQQLIEARELLSLAYQELYFSDL